MSVEHKGFFETFSPQRQTKFRWYQKHNIWKQKQSGNQQNVVKEEEKEAKAKMKLQFADEDSQDEIDSDDLNNSDDFDNELDESFSSQSQNDIDESMDEIESQLQNETLTAQAGDSGQSESTPLH